MVNETLINTTTFFGIHQTESLIYFLVIYIISLIFVIAVINYKDNNRFSKLIHFLNAYKYWLILIIFSAIFPIGIAIIYNNSALGSFSIAIASTLGVIISIYKNRLNLLEERDINKNTIEKQLKQQRENFIIMLNYPETKKILVELREKLDLVRSIGFEIDSIDKTRYLIAPEEVEEIFLSGRDYFIIMFGIYQFTLFNNPFMPKKIKKDINKFMQEGKNKELHNIISFMKVFDNIKNFINSGDDDKKLFLDKMTHYAEFISHLEFICDKIEEGYIKFFISPNDPSNFSVDNFYMFVDYIFYILDKYPVEELVLDYPYLNETNFEKFKEFSKYDKDTLRIY